MEVKKILENALKLSKKVSFIVELVDYDNQGISLMSMTYLELGTYLMTHTDHIKLVTIKLKEWV